LETIQPAGGYFAFETSNCLFLGGVNHEVVVFGPIVHLLLFAEFKLFGLLAFVFRLDTNSLLPIISFCQLQAMCS
jgi:hypothetical protein